MAAHAATVATRFVADPDRILDSLSTSVLIVDQKLSLLYLNVAAETLFGVQDDGSTVERCPIPHRLLERQRRERLALPAPFVLGQAARKIGDTGFIGDAD